MKTSRLTALSALLVLAPTLVAAEVAVPVGAEGNYTENFDTPYNGLTVQRDGTVVELRARSRRGVFLESAVDLADPLRLIVGYTRTLYAAEFLHPRPQRVLMIGLGGAGFHRLFVHAHPEALLQSVELDPKVFELCQTRLGFKPTAQTPVTVMDGRMFVKRNPGKWDWLILDAFRGGHVPAHLKTEEFYRACAARLSDRGVFLSNLHATTALYHADLKTIGAVFPQVVLFQTPGTGNVIACAVNYRTPAITDPAAWPAAAEVAKPFTGRLDFAEIRKGHLPIPTNAVAAAKLLTDDFAPVEFLDAIRSNNAAKDQ